MGAVVGYVGVGTYMIEIIQVLQSDTFVRRDNLVRLQIMRWRRPSKNAALSRTILMNRG